MSVVAAALASVAQRRRMALAQTMMVCAGAAVGCQQLVFFRFQKRSPNFGPQLGRVLKTLVMRTQNL